jgi:glycine/D-amino acid oxidase-like deaminating enzyme
MNSSSSPIVVIGAGILGASVAYHLARQGVPVTLIDRARSPASGATSNSFAWFSGVGGDWPGGAKDLRGAVLTDYQRLEAEIPGLPVRWSGSLVWADASVRRSGSTPVVQGQHWVGRSDIVALEPHLHTIPERAIYTPTDGGIDPVQTTAALVQAARAHGAQVLLNAGDISLNIVGGQVQGVQSAARSYPAATVVVAAGAGVNALCEPLKVALPIGVSPAFWMQVAAPPGLVKHILVSPACEVRESRVGLLRMTALHDDGASESALHQLAEATVEYLRSAFGGTDQLRLLGYGVCRRPMPTGGPLVGYITPDRSVYVTVMHSAICLAPTVGRLVAHELASGKRVAELESCRPPRFSSS